MTGKQLKIIIPVALLIILVFYFSSNSGIKSISTEELKERLEQESTSKETYFVDVREISEYEAGHVKGMINIPLSSLKDTPLDIDKKSDIILFCRSGNRSMQAAKILQDQGYENIVNVKGGIQSWQGDIVKE